ncbi:MAG: hypothetical protein RLZZ476_2309, partial [Verrucomicrobiota bacterium]
MQPFLRIHPADDAIVALRDLDAGPLPGSEWTLREKIAAKQKFAARDFAAGDRVTMYGVLVGTTMQAVPRGALLHTHNLKHASATFTGKQGSYSWNPPDVSKWASRSFRGFKRPQGPAGTANHWIVIPLVFCENRNLGFMREALVRELGYGKTSSYERFARKMADLQRRGASQDEIAAAVMDAEAEEKAARLFPNVDGVKFLEHGLGCGGTRQDAQALCRLLAGYIHSPNVCGATVLSLGCQHAQVSLLEQEMAALYPKLEKPLLIYEQQKSLSERDMMQRALRDTFLGLAKANEQTREPCPLADLIMAVECGGSDGFSGISANPAIGHTADLLAALGGAPVLSEFPELC